MNNVPVSRKGSAYGKISGGPSTGAKQGHSGHIKFGGKVFTGVTGKAGSKTTENAAAPAWVAGGIPDQSDADADQPLSLSAGDYLEASPFPTSYALVTPPAGFTIGPSSGVIAVVDAAVAAHSINVTAINAQGTTGHTFTWTITA